MRLIKDVHDKSIKLGSSLEIIDKLFHCKELTSREVNLIYLDVIDNVWVVDTKSAEIAPNSFVFKEIALVKIQNRYTSGECYRTIEYQLDETEEQRFTIFKEQKPHIVKPVISTDGITYKW